MAENVLFGSQFEGRGIVDGVNEVVTKLVEIKDALKTVKEEITRLNGELDKNQLELAQTKKALDEATKAGDAKKIKELSDQIAVLKTQEQGLTKALKEQQVEQVVLTKGQALYNKEINETVRNNRAAKEELNKFGSVTRLAGEAVGRFRTFVTEAAFGLVSGFVGAIIAEALPALIKFGQQIIESLQHLDAFEKKQKAQKDVVESAAKSVAGEVVKLEAYRKVLTDLSVPEKERLKVAKEFNETADTKIQIDATQINNITTINKLLDDQKEKLLAVALANAAVAKIQKLAEPFLEEDLKLRLAAQQMGTTQKALEGNLKLFGQLEDRANKNRIVIRGATAGAVANPIRKEDQELIDNFSKSVGLTEEELTGLFDTFSKGQKAKKDLDDVTNALKDLFTPASVTKTGPDKGDTPVNVFVRELTKIQDATKQFNAQKFPSELTVAASFQSALQKQLLEIDKFLDKKSHEQLTKPQADFIKSLITKLSVDQQNQALEEFRRKVQDLNDRLNETLVAEQTDLANKRIANIRDDFEKERQQIDQGFVNNITAITKARDGLLKSIDDAERQGLDHATAQRKRLATNELFGGLFDAAEAQKRNQQLDLSFKVFQHTLEVNDTVFENTLTETSKNIADRVVQQKQLLAAHTISYATFEKNVTKLLKQEKEERDQIKREELQQDLNRVNVRIAFTTDPEQKAKLQKQANEIQDQISAIDKNIEGQKENPTNKRLESLVKYATSAGELLNKVGQFWQQLNAQEEKSLEKSISLQEKRVEEARRIAEHGNAEFLNEEQDRLDQLELKREASARKQQAINSALVLSNALVATVSAIAQAAQTSGPAAPFAAIAAGIAVIGAIAAAFQFVQSLQPPTATFFKGTEDVQLGGNKPGIDTVPARLTEHERVVTARENKDYFETLTAIHNRKVSPELLNSFVRQTLTGQNSRQTKNELTRTQKEVIREKAEKDRLTKSDKQLIKEVAEQVSNSIVNNQHTDRVMNYVNNLLTERFRERPVFVPAIMKMIRENITSKELTRERTDLQKISSTLDTFTDKIEFVQHNLINTFQEKQSEHLIERLSSLIKTRDAKDSLHLIQTELHERLNRQDARVVVPWIMNRLERIDKTPGKTDRLEVIDAVSSFAKTLNERMIDKKSTREVINHLTKVIHNNRDSHAMIMKIEHDLKERIIDPEQTKILVPFIKDQVRNNIQEKVFTRGQNPGQLERITTKFAERINAPEKEKVIQQIFRDRFIQEHQEFQESIEAILDKRIDSTTVNNFVQSLQNNQEKRSRVEQVERMERFNEIFHNNVRTEIPVVSFSRLEHAIDHSTEMKGLLNEQIRIMKVNNDLQTEQNKILRTMGFTFNWDKEGVAASFMTYMEQKKRDEKI